MQDIIFHPFTLGAIGALALEILKAYEKRTELHKSKYRNILKSPLFWIISMMWILLAGFVVMIINDGAEKIIPLQCFFAGMGIRTILNNGLKAAQEEKIKSTENKETQVAESVKNSPAPALTKSISSAPSIADAPKLFTINPAAAPISSQPINYNIQDTSLKLKDML